MSDMIVRVLVLAALVGGAALALWHPAPHAAITAVTPSAAAAFAQAPDRPRHSRFQPGQDPIHGELVVYVAGAVRRPGSIVCAKAIATIVPSPWPAVSAPAQMQTGVNLAQRAADGDEVLVPRAGETTYRRRSRSRSAHPSSRRHRRMPSAPAEGSVDVNHAAPEDLARVPGIGRAIAGRIVELRDREGAFASLDELLDVAGMTQSRLARARPYLQDL